MTLRYLFKSSIIVITVRVIGIVLQSIVILVLARVLPAGEMGIFALHYAILGLARMLGPLGMDQTTMRAIAQAKENSSVDDLLHRVLNASTLLVFLVSLVVAATFGALALLLPQYASESEGASASFLYVALAIPAFSLSGLLTLQLRGFGYQIWAQIPDSIVLQVVFSGILILHWRFASVDLDSATLSLLISAWVVASFYLVSRLKLGVRYLLPTLSDCIGLVRASLDIFLALGLTALAVRGPLFVVSSILGSAATAVLDIATRFGSLPTVTTSSVAATFSPRFAALSDPLRRKELFRTLLMASLVSVVPALLVFVTLALGAPFVLDSVLPATYGHAYLPMLLICGAQVVNAWFGPNSNLLMMIGRGNVVRNFSIAHLLIIFCGCSIAALLWGLVGVAAAILIAQIFRDVGAYVWVLSRLRMHDVTKGHVADVGTKR